jgi:hypothetical protein
MKRIFITSGISALLSTAALADTSSMNGTVSGMGILENSYIRAGVNGTSGTLGSGGNTSPGLLFDSTGTGTFNTGYDYLTPGSPFDGFAVKVDGTNYTNNNSGAAAITGDGSGLTNGTNTLSWTGGVAGVFDITNSYSLGATSQYIDITSSITANTAIGTLSFGRFIDPDARAATGDSSATDNVLGYGTIPDSNVAFSEALSSRYALGLYSTDGNVDAGITRWTTDADSYTENSIDGAGINTNTGDNTIGLSWAWSGVGVGDILTSSYAYIFGPSAFDASTNAIAGGAGGGVDITTGTLVDVGSATDAAAGVAAPTVVSTAITSSTVVTEAISTSLPVLTASITAHTATETATVQTIARETTTSVTTPMDVTTTVTPTTSVTYSDASIVATVGTPVATTALRNDVVTTITDPGSFVAHTDQIANAQTMQNMAARDLNFNGVNIVSNNASNGNTHGFIVGNTKDLGNGVTVGAGIGLLTSNTTSTDGSADANTKIVNLNGKKKVGGGTVSVDLTHARMDLTASRTIGDFSNAGTTSGTDISISARFVADGEKVRPVFGYTRGQTAVNSYTETGSIQSARTVADATDYYGYATIGAQVSLASGLEAQALRYTDGVNSLSLDLDNEWEENKSTTLSVERLFSNIGNTTKISLVYNIKF